MEAVALCLIIVNAVLITTIVTGKGITVNYVHKYDAPETIINEENEEEEAGEEPLSFNMNQVIQSIQETMGVDSDHEEGR